MKGISLKIFLLIAVISFSSCEKFLDVNDDKDSPFTSTPDSLLPAVLGNLSISHYDHGEAVSYFTQQVTPHSAWHKYKVRWDYVDANRIAQWRRHYHDVSINALHVIESAQREGNALNYEVVATVAYAASTLMTSDLFGDIAYSEAFKGKPNAKYDPQEEVYANVLDLLDDAIMKADEYLANPSGYLEMVQPIDNIYFGDISKWKAYAYALKARTYMRAPYGTTDWSKVIENAQLALDNGFENAAYDYSFASANDWQVNAWGRSKADPSWETQDNILDVSAPTEFFLYQCLNYDAETNTVNDPRQPLLMSPRYPNPDLGGELSYLAIHPGVGKVANIEPTLYPDLYDSYMTMDTGKQLFFSKEELYFIMAEAYFNTNPNMALTNLRLGIEEHMLHVGVDAADISAYLSSEFVPQNTSDLRLYHIMMQKHIGLWLQGEVWVDMRRHGYSNQVYKGLKRPENLVWYFADDANEAWIERLPYDTETEEIYNADQLREMGAYQNPHWLKKKMIWAKQ